MSKSKKKSVCKNVGALKKFLEDIPDKTPIRDNFDYPIRFYLWEKEPMESGPKLWLGIADGYYRK